MNGYGYTYWREMREMENMIQKDKTFDVCCKPIMTKRKEKELYEKMKKNKEEYERKTGKSLSEERKRLLKGI